MKRENDICHNCDELSRCYSMIDNLRDDIQDLKQQLALETAALHDAIKELANKKKQLANAEAETEKKILKEIADHCFDEYGGFIAKNYVKIEKKYGVEG